MKIQYFAIVSLLAGCGTNTSRHADRKIADDRRVNLGGIEQAIWLRGDDRSNPVVLFLHGGPGVPEMPLAYKDADLQRDFVVVHWDQRGAGKSYRSNTPGMNFGQFVNDTLKLARLLRAEFGQRKIILVGHSWGSLVGALAAARQPELFRAYIGVEQLVNIPASERELDKRSLAVARETGNVRALRQLQEVGPYPYPTHRQEQRVNKIQKDVMGHVPDELPAARFLELALLSPDYSLPDYFKAVRGISFSGKALEREIYTANLFASAPEIAAPVYFFEGRHDTVLSPVIAARYEKQLTAPRGKHFIWFEHTNHWPQLEEAEKYRAMIRRVRDETANDQPTS